MSQQDKLDRRVQSIDGQLSKLESDKTFMKVEAQLGRLSSSYESYDEKKNIPLFITGLFFLHMFWYVTIFFLRRRLYLS